uniref:Putative secreted protein n=1 Tax=Anopheles marajoara TaxID=58244 RepID=A0A2M4CD65_9DIPT
MCRCWLCFWTNFFPGLAVAYSRNRSASAGSLNAGAMYGNVVVDKSTLFVMYPEPGKWFTSWCGLIRCRFTFRNG